MPVELHAEDFCPSGGQVTLVNSSGGPPRGDCVEFEPLTLSLGAGSGDFPGGGGRCEVECTIDKHD